jgi:hypothetical protein
MQKDYYQNILYPLQDKVLKLIGSLSVDFYLTGGTALSRAYLNHRYSDDLDFFVNRSANFKAQVEIIVRSLPQLDLKFEKDMWVNPIEAAKILDEFPVHKLTEINWINKMPDNQWFESQLKVIIKDLLQGNSNSLYPL